MGESCKASFVLDCAKLGQMEAFAQAHNMNVSEAFRFVIDCGLETLNRAGYEMGSLPLGHGATRGIFPAPDRREQHGNSS